MTTRASLITWSQNCPPASPQGLEPPPFVRGAPKRLFSAPQTVDVRARAAKVCGGTGTHAQKGCCLIAMFFLQPCIEKRYTLSAEQGFADRQRFFVFLSSRAVFQGCSSQKCAAVQGRAEKGCCLITMIYIQPCIEKRYTLSAEQGFADRQRFSYFCRRELFSGAARLSRAPKNACCSAKAPPCLAVHFIMRSCRRTLGAPISYFTAK